MMELKTFVAKTLLEIKQGVIEAQAGGVSINWSYYKDVDFDVSVTTQATDESKGKAGIFVSVVGAGIETAEGNNKTSMTRVKFSVQIGFDKNPNE